MIRTLTYRANLDGKDGDKVAEAIRTQVSKMVRTRAVVLGVKVTHDSEKIDIALRMTGMDRWMISRDARKVASYLLASQKLPFTRPLAPVLELDEPNARRLTLEQGRVPQKVTGGRPRRSGRTGSSGSPGAYPRASAG